MPEATIPIFSSEELKKNFKHLGDEGVKFLINIATKFVKENQDNILALGQDSVKAILFSELYEVIPVPKLPSNATPIDREIVEKILNIKSLKIAIIAAAQRQHNERVAAVQNSAKEVALEVSSFIMTNIWKAVLGTALETVVQ